MDVWGIAPTVLLWLLPVVRAFGAFDDVIMGLIADRTNTRWGKFRPYLLFGAIPYGICGYLIFAGPDLSPNGKTIYAFVTYALMMVSYTVINVPYSAMLGVISPSPRTRTVASTYRFVGAFGAAFLISLFVRPLVEYLGAGNETRGFQLTMAIFAVVSVVLILITFATTKERVSPPPQTEQTKPTLPNTPIEAPKIVQRELVPREGAVASPAIAPSTSASKAAPATAPAGSFDADLDRFLYAPGFPRFGRAVDQYLAILTWLIEKYPQGRLAVASYRRGSRRYFAGSAEEINRSARSANPKPVGSTGFYALTTTDTATKRSIVDELLKVCGLRLAVREKAVSSILS